MTFTRNSLRAFAAAALVAMLSCVSLPARAAFPQFPAASGGGGGAVASVSGTSGVTCSPTTGAVSCSASNVPLGAFATQADQTILGNVSGGSAVPIAMSAAQVLTMIGAQNSGAVAITGGAISGVTLLSITSGVGINTSTTNLGTFAAGTAVMTAAGTGSTGAAIEMKMPTTTSLAKVIGSLSAWNGTTNSVWIQFHNNSSTTDGIVRMFLGATLGTLYEFNSTQIKASQTVSFVSTGSMTVGTIAATSLALESNSATRLTLSSAGVMTLDPSVSLVLGSGTLAANGVVATALSSVGPTGSHTTVQEWMLVTGTGAAARWIPMF